MSSDIVYAEHRIKMPTRYLIEALWLAGFGVLPWIVWLLGYQPGWLFPTSVLISGVAVAFILFQHVTGFFIRKNSRLKFRGNRDTGLTEVWMHKPPHAWKKYFTVLENQVNIHNLTSLRVTKANTKPALMLHDKDALKRMVVPWRVGRLESVKDFLLGKINANSSLSVEEKKLAEAFLTAEDEAAALALETKTKRTLF